MKYNIQAARSAYILSDLDKENGLAHVRGRMQNADEEDKKDFIQMLSELK